ncbi:hypothetical protein ACWCRF_05880 [Streptomyces sp. NPDC002405]|uniref:hypothetical protein n=1 Tax=Streptomyces sp. NPDC001231 TaxID=3364549 RepID=UPI0036A25429
MQVRPGFAVAGAGPVWPKCRPGYARGILLPALQRAVSRPRPPLYGAFTQAFTAQLGALFTDDPPSDAVPAGRLDEALRRALPGLSATRDEGAETGG